ncbi:PilN domain-containing protein [Thiolapillus sp.]
MALAASLAQALRQWRKQLLDCLPDAWRERISSRITPYILELGPESARLLRDGRPLEEIRIGEGGMDAGTAARLKSHEYPLVLMLPAPWVLSRTVVLPAAAAENLRQVLGFELDRLTPFAADQVYFDYQLLPRESAGDMLSVAVALVPRKRVDGWLEKLRGAGIPVDAMTAAALGEEANLLPAEMRARPELKRLALNALPVVLVLVLLAGALVLPLWQKRELASSLQQKENALRAKAAEVMKIRETLDKELQAVQKISGQWQSAPPVLDILQVLTNLLPDDTSLQRLEIKGDELVINGTSGQASSLIGLLQKAPGFDNPHFLSPVTQQRGKELFNLSATIVMPFPREPGVERIVANPEDRPPPENAQSARQSADQGRGDAVAAGQGMADSAAARPGDAKVAPASPAGAGSSRNPPSESGVISYPGKTGTRPLTHIQGSSNSAPVPDRIGSGSGS